MTNVECARCRLMIALGGTVLANTDIIVCRTCEHDWLLAPESHRLRAISASIFAEWVERERRERIVVEEEKKANTQS